MENISKLDVFDRKHHNHCRRNIKAVSLKDFTFLLKKKNGKENRLHFRDETTGATSTTVIVLKFSDTLTTLYPRFCPPLQRWH